MFVYVVEMKDTENDSMWVHGVFASESAAENSLVDLGFEDGNPGLFPWIRIAVHNVRVAAITKYEVKE